MLFVPKTVIFLILLIMGESSSHNMSSNMTLDIRRKRIVHGKIITDRTAPYDVMKYYVWLGNAHNCDTTPSKWQKFAHFLFATDCSPSPDNLSCGGALISPKVVATAAHCVSEKKESSGPSHWKSFVRKNVFTNMMEIFMGYNNVAEFSGYVKSVSFIIHEKYKQMTEQPYHASYDYGWVVMLIPIVKSDLNKEDITYAPLLKEEDIITVYNRVRDKEYACIIAGFGQMENEMTLDPAESGPASTVMRYGWVSTMSYAMCHWSQYIDQRQLAEIETYVFEEYASWICQQEFGANWARFGSGDSGGPVTCNNWYVAIISLGSWSFLDDPDQEYMIQHNEALRFATFQFSANYRRRYDKFIEEYWEEEKDKFWFFIHQHGDDGNLRRFSAKKLPYNEVVVKRSSSPHLQCTSFLFIVVITINLSSCLSSTVTLFN